MNYQSLRPLRPIFLKELRQLLRDSHILLFTLGVPLLFYPLLIWGTFQFLLLEEGISERDPPRVAILGMAELHSALQADPLIIIKGSVADLKAGRIDALVVGKFLGESLQVELHYNSTRPRSKRAYRLLKERLHHLEDLRLDALAVAYGLSPAQLRPWSIEEKNLAPASEMLAFLLSQLLSGGILFIMLLAALYPTIEIAVGEREQQTLETSLSSAVSRWQLIFGKLLVIVTLVLIAVLGNLVAMTLTALHLGYLLGSKSLNEWTLPLNSLPWALLPLVSGVLLISSMMLCAMLPARSFKQAQNLGNIPMLIGTGLAFVSFIPTLELDPITALLPLTNIALALQAAIQGQLSAALALQVSLVSIVLATLFLFICGRIIDRESYLFSLQPPAFWRKRFVRND